MKLLRVILLQLEPSDNENDAIEKGIKYCKLAKEKKADIVLFPEMWNIGYRFPESSDDLANWIKKSVDISSVQNDLK